MTKLEEKIKLAEEVGLKDWGKAMLEKQALQEEIAAMTQLKFKITTPSKIQKQLCKLYFDVPGTSIVPFFSRAQLTSMQLSDWKDNLPFGAFHALKEAKKAGLGNFQIYYPITWERERLMADPVIVGFKDLKQKETPVTITHQGVPTSSALGLIDAYRQAFGLDAGWMNPFGSTLASSRRFGDQMYEVHAWDDGKVYD